MNIYDAIAVSELSSFEARWENANPYEGLCDEERCVKGKKCKECNPEVEDDN